MTNSSFPLETAIVSLFALTLTATTHSNLAPVHDSNDVVEVHVIVTRFVMMDEYIETIYFFNEAIFSDASAFVKLSSSGSFLPSSRTAR